MIYSLRNSFFHDHVINLFHTLKWITKSCYNKLLLRTNGTIKNRKIKMNDSCYYA